MVITSAKAYANNEVGLVAWTVDAPDPDCLGFEITRVIPLLNEERVLPAWVPFEGQSNKKRLPQTTSVWPVQKLWWRDLTLRKKRDNTQLRPEVNGVKYRIRAVGKNGQEKVPAPAGPQTYEGDPLPLYYMSLARETNSIDITRQCGKYFKAAFTNGILAAQWLKSAIESTGDAFTLDNIRKHIQTPRDPIRQYLTGDVFGTLLDLINRAAAENGKVLLALYELSDQELTDAIKNNKQRIKLILSNSSKGRSSPLWDEGNQNFRKQLRDAGVEIHDRMFNNSAHIGHNKFAVLLANNGDPKAVMTGSTNWTPTGLCGQTNNAVLIESPAVAAQYKTYWQRLLDDNAHFVAPITPGASTSNSQAQPMRTQDAAPPADIKLDDGTTVTLWYSPNTKQTTKTAKSPLPPDLSQVFSLMRKAKKAIFFAAFLPSRSGTNSIISEAIAIGVKDPSLMVYGAISDPTAMPNYVPPVHAPPGEEDDASVEEEHKIQPAIFDQGLTHIVRATALTKEDVIGNFEREQLKLGNAIIHDKIVVVDPLSPDGFVAFGSHNMGYKASYCNDENLLIVRNNQALVLAYTVHVMDVYDHYRFRAHQSELQRVGKKSDWDGFLARDGNWLSDTINSERIQLARYFAG